MTADHVAVCPSEGVGARRAVILTKAKTRAPERRSAAWCRDEKMPNFLCLYETRDRSGVSFQSYHETLDLSP